jgi:hypothetical protein
MHVLQIWRLQGFVFPPEQIQRVSHHPCRNLSPYGRRPYQLQFHSIAKPPELTNVVKQLLDALEQLTSEIGHSRPNFSSQFRSKDRSTGPSRLSVETFALIPICSVPFHYQVHANLSAYHSLHGFKNKCI